MSIRRAVLLALVLLVLAVQAMLPIDDPDIWWRLRVGEWIVSHRSVPYFGIFSANDVGTPWLEYSWGFALIVYAVHSYMGLTGLVYFIVLMGLTIAYVCYKLIQSAALPIAVEIAIVALALGGMKSLMTPRPWLFTLLFFAIELLLIYRAKRSGNERLLWYLPLLFFIWANMHIQFVYGLAALSLLFVEALLARYLSGYREYFADSLVGLRVAGWLVASCVAATLITPYHYLLYKQIFSYMFVQVEVFQYLAELHPMLFRSPGDWMVLAVSLLAAFSLGRQNKLSLFSTMLLLISVIAGFRARRDVWMVAIASLAIVGDVTTTAVCNRVSEFTKGQLAITFSLVVGVLGFVAYNRGINENDLNAVVKKEFPVGAVQFVKSHRLSGPLFNHYDWGGFLLWSLPEIPPSMDGRTQIFGDWRVQRSLAAWDGAAGWESEPDLLSAKLVIAEKQRPLTALLKQDATFKQVFEDDNAVVFIRN